MGDRDALVAANFTVADANLVTLLNWFRYVGMELAKWPTLLAYHRRRLSRPAVASAMADEMAKRKRRAP